MTKMQKDFIADAKRLSRAKTKALDALKLFANTYKKLGANEMVILKSLDDIIYSFTYGKLCLKKINKKEKHD